MYVQHTHTYVYIYIYAPCMCCMYTHTVCNRSTRYNDDVFSVIGSDPSTEMGRLSLRGCGEHVLSVPGWPGAPLRHSTKNGMHHGSKHQSSGTTIHYIQITSNYCSYFIAIDSIDYNTLMFCHCLFVYIFLYNA